MRTMLLTFLVCLTVLTSMWMSAGFCQSMARNLTVQEAAAAAVASTWMAAGCGSSFCRPVSTVEWHVHRIDKQHSRLCVTF